MAEESLEKSGICEPKKKLLLDTCNTPTTLRQHLLQNK